MKEARLPSSPGPRAALDAPWPLSSGSRLSPGSVSRQSELDATAAAIVSASGVVAAAVADVGDRQALQSAIESIRNQLGPVDVLVTNAGFGKPTQLDPLNTTDVEETIRVNVMRVIY